MCFGLRSLSAHDKSRIVKSEKATTEQAAPHSRAAAIICRSDPGAIAGLSLALVSRPVQAPRMPLRGSCLRCVAVFDNWRVYVERLEVYDDLQVV